MSLDRFESAFLGKTVYFRTVTYAVVGTVVEIDARHVWLHPAADVVETGAFRTFFAGSGGTYEPIPTTPDSPAMVARGALVRAEVWPHVVPK